MFLKAQIPARGKTRGSGPPCYTSENLKCLLKIVNWFASCQLGFLTLLCLIYIICFLLSVLMLSPISRLAKSVTKVKQMACSYSWYIFSVFNVKSIAVYFCHIFIESLTPVLLIHRSVLSLRDQISLSVC